MPLEETLAAQSSLCRLYVAVPLCPLDSNGCAALCCMGAAGMWLSLATGHGLKRQGWC